MTTLKRLDQAIASTLTEVQENYDKGGVDYVGLPTGLHKVDKYLGGLRPAAVYVCGARTGMGKTALAVTIAMNIAKQGKSVLYLSFEMSAELLSLRVLSGMTQIPAQDIERGRITSKQMDQLKKTASSLDNLNFMLYDKVMTSEALIDYLEDYREEYGLDLLIADYVGLFRDENKFGNVERLGRVSNNINSIAHEYNIPVLLLAQLNREVDKRESHTPVLTDLRDSGDIEQDAFAVLLVKRPQYYAQMFDGAEEQACESDAEIIIAKNRQGPTGITRARFYPKELRWEQDPPELTKPPRVNVGTAEAPIEVPDLSKESLVERVRKGRS